MRGVASRKTEPGDFHRVIEETGNRRPGDRRWIEDGPGQVEPEAQSRQSDGPATKQMTPAIWPAFRFMFNLNDIETLPYNCPSTPAANLPCRTNRPRIAMEQEASESVPGRNERRSPPLHVVSFSTPAPDGGIHPVARKEKCVGNKTSGRGMPERKHMGQLAIWPIAGDFREEVP